MKFVELAAVFEQIEQESSRTTITTLLSDLFLRTQPEEAQVISYLALGSLFPPYKILQLNIAKKGMVALTAALLNESQDVVNLRLKEVGDIGQVLYQVCSQSDQGLSVIEVYEQLVQCAHISGVGSTEKKQTFLINLFRQVDAISAKYIARIITGTLRLGFSDMTILDSLSWMQVGDKSIRKDLEHAYNVCADLGLVAYTLKQEGLAGIQKMGIQIGIPIRPSSAERLNSAQAIVDKLGSCVAQPKLDGFRLQVHLCKNNGVKISFFSRNLLDMSEMFPDLQQIVHSLPVDSVIFEGEAIVYDENSETFLPFQQTVKRKRKHGVQQASEQFPLRLYLFDILYLNGESLLDKTHRQRRALLDDLGKHTDTSRLYVIEEQKIESADQLQNYFLKNIHLGLEGLVVKREDAIYQPGKRNFNWIKLKKHARGKLVDTIDCVILGYYYGSGKRTKFGVGAFLVGVYNKDLDRFQTVAKIGTGMKDSEWIDLKEKCKQFEQSAQPHNVDVAKDLIPDVWVLPEIVCTIQSDEITQSPVHSAGLSNNQLGLALRFPRFITYRSDKSAQDATTVQELRSLYKEQLP